jgi:DNA modification methylase
MTASIHHADDMLTLWHGGALEVAGELTVGGVQTIVTSPPYFGLRDYGHEAQLGAEDTVEEYVADLVAVFHALRPALADDGTLWLNLGDSYAGRANAGPTYTGNHQNYKKEGRVPGRKSTTAAAPTKNLIGVPWRVAFALQDDGWILRSEIIWAKPNPMPESVTDRPTKSHEQIFLLSKRPNYYYNADAIAERVSDRPDARPQRKRAIQIAKAGGLTQEHLTAIRAVGISDVGKALVTTNGAGKNSEEMNRLAAEAKEVLGGYYREFLMGDTRNARDVWIIPTMPFSGAHFAVYPPALIRPCILAGSRPGDTVLDPFSGSGTTGMVALAEGRNYVGIDISTEYLDLSLRERFLQPPLSFGGEF